MGYGLRSCFGRRLHVLLLTGLCLLIFISLILHDSSNVSHVKPILFERPKRFSNQCTYSACLNVTQCAYEYPDKALHKIGVFIHLPQESRGLEYSNEFMTVLTTIRSSQYYVSDPGKACLFIPNVDLLNGFAPSFRRSLHALAELFKHNNGSNHLVFNFLWNENLYYTDMSILASVGHSLDTYRATFDISLPSYNPLGSKWVQEPLLGMDSRFLLTIFPEISQQSPRNLHSLLALYRSPHFKGNQTVILFDVCDHMAESYSIRCVRISRSPYLAPINQTVRYPWILSQSLFCLITKATNLNRLALFDSMASGCIPVIADDTFVLPFFEILDWARIAIRIRQHQFEMIPLILTTYSATEILRFQKQIRFVYEKYFSSLEKIVLTTLDILNDRVYPYYAKTYSEWNDPDYVQTYLPTPPVLFYPLRVSSRFGFTALIRGQDHFGMLSKLLQKLHLVPSVRRILVVWTNPTVPFPELSLWPSLNRPLFVIPADNNSVVGRFYPYETIDTEAVLSLDENTYLPSVAEIERAFEYYLNLYQEFLSNAARSLINSMDCCENYFLHWLIVQTSGQPITNVKSAQRNRNDLTTNDSINTDADNSISVDRCLRKLPRLEQFIKPFKTKYYPVSVLNLTIDTI